MKKYFKGIISVFCLITAISSILLFSGFDTKSKVTSNLDEMLSDQDAIIYSHTMVYSQKHSKLYNEILALGENAIGDLMKDFIAHPENRQRRQLIIDLVSAIALQEELAFNTATQSWYASDSDWFEAVGKNLYEKYVGNLDSNSIQNNQNNSIEQQKTIAPQKTILRGKEFEFEEGSNIPEPEGAVPPGDGIKWDTRLGCYILENIYYDEINGYYYMIN